MNNTYSVKITGGAWLAIVAFILGLTIGYFCDGKALITVSNSYGSGMNSRVTLSPE